MKTSTSSVWPKRSASAKDLGAHWEMWMFGKGGKSPLEAIRTATANPVHYLGMGKDIGSLEVGKLADLLILAGDILADIRQSEDLLGHVQWPPI